MGWGNNNPRNPNAPCPDPNKHCGDDVVSVPIENPYLIAVCIIAIIIVVYFLMHPPKTTWLFKRKSKVIDDEYKVIRAGNITIAQGLKCHKCGLIRPYDKISCVCKSKNINHEQ